MKSDLKVGIVNVTGYSGVELARLLLRHPGVELVGVTGRSAVGQPLNQYFPHLTESDLIIEADLNDRVDLVFSALPQVASAEVCIPLIESGIKVIDISADFRLRTADEYEKWYGAEHPAPDLLRMAVYGLTEINREAIRKANLIANPGCYPTGAILALAPLIRQGLIQQEVVIDAKSGVSGAGRGLNLTTHFSEVNENLMPYQVDGHRHLPEIVQELGSLSNDYKPNLVFMPHLVPMTRGILCSCYTTLNDGAFASVDQARDAIIELYHDFYRGEPFVVVASAPPQTKQAWGNNSCFIYPTVDSRSGRVVVFSALDNLVKGAAGQAVQNMNLMLGLPETLGLEQIAIYP